MEHERQGLLDRMVQESEEESDVESPPVKSPKPKSPNPKSRSNRPARFESPASRHPFNHDESDDEPIYGHAADSRVMGVRINDDQDNADDLDTSNRNTYDDFTTIDWVRDQARERHRQRFEGHVNPQGFKERTYALFDAAQGWIVVLIIGVCGGFTAGTLDITVDWLSDFRLGICRGSFWLSKRDCCWAEVNIENPNGDCASWYFWNEVFQGKDPSDVDIDSGGAYAINYLIYVSISVFLAGLSAMLVKHYAPYAAGSGIPEVKTILGGFVIKGYLGTWTLLTKLVGASLSVASGLSLGKEGPMVHMCSCWGNIVARLFPKFRFNEAKKREILSASSACGVSVAFGAPIGGVLFSLEEVSYYFPHKTMWRSFFCAMIAAMTLKYMDPFRTGRLVLFEVLNDFHPWYLFELPAFAVLGVFGGLFGAAFNKLNVQWCAIRKKSRLRLYPVVEVLVITTITAMINYANPFQRGSASELIKQLFDNCSIENMSELCNGDNYKATLGLLALVALFKMVITVFTFGVRLPCGLFIPCMVIGATVGRIVGVGMASLVHQHRAAFVGCPADVTSTCVAPGLYAIVGSSAVLAGTTRMTVSMVVIMLELTGSLNYILPIMAAVLTAKWVGDSFSREGIYDSHIRLNGYPYLDNKQEFSHTTLAVDAMVPHKDDPPLVVINVDAHPDVESLERLLQDCEFNGFPVVTSIESMALVGYVSRNELKAALRKAREHGANSQAQCFFGLRPPSLNADDNFVHLRHCLDASPVQVTETTPMFLVLEMFRKLGLRSTLVTRNGRLVGIITKKDVINHMSALEHRDPAQLLFR